MPFRNDIYIPEEPILPVIKEPTRVEEIGIKPYPFQYISEIAETGKKYGEIALEAVKKVISYPWVLLEQKFEKKKPTGVIEQPWDWRTVFQSVLKPPWVFILIGIGGLWVYSIFKVKR